MSKKLKSLHPNTGKSIFDSLKQHYGAHLLSINPGGISDNVYQSCCFYYEAELLPLLPNDKSTIIVDIGSGLGHLLHYLSDNGYQNIGGVEIDEDLFLNSKKYIGSKTNFLINDDALHYIRGQIEAFDIVTLFDVIEHFSLDDAYELLYGIRESLKMDGVAIIRTPNMSNILGTYSRYMDLTHQSGYTEHSLIQLLREVGFSQMAIHIPNWNKNHPLSKQFKKSAEFQKEIYKMQDRALPTTFDKNIVVWGKK